MSHIPTNTLARVAVFFFILGAALLSLPSILAVSVQHEEKKALAAMAEQFPVTVNPREKRIVEDARVNTFLESSASPLTAAVGNVGDVVASIFAWVAIGIADAPWYQSLAAATVGDTRFVSITPGMRREQVANAFAKALVWSAAQKKEFLAVSATALPLSEGAFSPGIYTLAKGTTPSVAQALIKDRFDMDVLSHYGTTTARMVPLDQALAIASLIEREAGGSDDRRVISGIIWNRLFINMNLQIDATLQYVKADASAAQGWWPKVVPADRFRKSAYNTYLHPGLPPTPIASPSVAAILAALNPRETSCLFYFHDANRQFHCTDTYAEHVALLKKYYGRGK